MHFIFNSDDKQVLRSLNGEFHSRELSAIMGESTNPLITQHLISFHKRPIGFWKVKLT